MSISGVRGIVGNGLDARIAHDLGAAFGAFLRMQRSEGMPKVAIGRDTRASGPDLENACIEGLLYSGCEVLRFGVVPTPTAQVNVSLLNLDGAVVVSASHNPAEWNGFKFIGPRGVFLNSDEAGTFLRLYHSKQWPQLGKGYVSNDGGAMMRHLERIFSKLDITDSWSELKVAVDAVNGAGAVANPRLLDFLGVDYKLLYGEATGEFLRGTEPIPEHLGELGKLVQSEGCHIGFAQDPDADRLAIVDEQGQPLGEDLTVVLGLDALLSTAEPGPKKIVVSLSTSMAVDDVAKKYRATVIRTPVGEVNVSEAMIWNAAFAGGEGNGGLINPQIGFGRDSLGAMALILKYLHTHQTSVSAWAAPYRKYTILKHKITLPPHVTTEAVLALAREMKTNGTLNQQDGVKITWSDRWLHVRSSNTEPVIRLIAEATKQEKAESLITDISVAIQKLVDQTQVVPST